MRIKAAVFDVDGTLTSEKDQTLVASNIDACRQLQAKGIKIVIASGRASCAMSVLDGIIKPDYYIGATGAEIADGDKNPLWLAPIPKELMDELTAYCEQRQIGILWKFRERSCCYVNDGVFMPWMAMVNPTFEMNRHPDPNALPLGAAILLNKDSAPDAIAHFAGRLTMEDGGLYVYDAQLAGINKGFGLRKWQQITGIKKEEIIAFGDSDNDLSMLEGAGISVAMGNAYDHVKTQVDYVTDNASADGILHALQHFNIL